MKLGGSGATGLQLSNSLSFNRKIDKFGERVISQEEFRAAIESQFNLNLSDIEFEQFIDSVPLDDEGKVKYQSFMSQFDAK